MADPTQHEAAERDVDHSLGYVDALFVVADEPAPADHPAQGPLDHPAARQDSEAWLVGEAGNDLDDEAEKGRLVHQLAAIVSAVGKEVLEPWRRRCPRYRRWSD